MIKVIYKPLQPDLNYSVVPTFDIKQVDNKLILNANVLYYEATYQKEFEFDISSYAGSVIQIDLACITKSDLEFVTYDMFKRVQPEALLKNSRIQMPDYRIIRIVFEENGTDATIFSFDSKLSETTFTACECIDLVPGFTSVTESLAANSHTFSKIFDKYKKKADIINVVDIYSTVAYLESQIDILTKIILNNNTELLDVLRVADSKSVLDIKSIDQIKSEFLQDKAEVRRLQSEYYESKKDSN